MTSGIGKARRSLVVASAPTGTTASRAGSRRAAGPSRSRRSGRARRAAALRSSARRSRTSRTAVTLKTRSTSSGSPVGLAAARAGGGGHVLRHRRSPAQRGPGDDGAVEARVEPVVLVDRARPVAAHGVGRSAAPCRAGSARSDRRCCGRTRTTRRPARRRQPITPSSISSTAYCAASLPLGDEVVVGGEQRLAGRRHRLRVPEVGRVDGALTRSGELELAADAGSFVWSCWSAVCNACSVTTSFKSEGSELRPARGDPVAGKCVAGHGQAARDRRRRCCRASGAGCARRW